MKQLSCEMCGSTELVKQEGFFVCQTCGCKYSVEEAKKMMIEGTVEVQGMVKVDNSDELKNLYQAARNARETSDDATALKHYESISAKDPNSWEALFYLVILKTNKISNGEIETAAWNITNSLTRVFELIKETEPDGEERKKCVKEVVGRCTVTAYFLQSASDNFYASLTKGNGAMLLGGIGGIAASLSSTGQAIQYNKDQYFAIASMMKICGDSIETFFGLEDADYKKMAVSLWKDAIELDTKFKKKQGSHIYNQDGLNGLTSQIKKYDPEYGSEQDQGTGSSGGCYVATAVYGSYDCSEVWTLRRFRDYTLAKTWYGRAFIRTYYAVSPTIVKWFGHTEWFKKMWKGKLDRMVSELQAMGVESTPYEDRNW